MTPLIISEELKAVLDKAVQNKDLKETIEKLRILEVDEDAPGYINYLSIAKDDDSKLSYLNKKKIEGLDETWGEDMRKWDPSYRIMGKPGKILQALLPDTSPVILEKFASIYKTQAAVCGNCLDANIVSILRGADIQKYYNDNNYYSGDDCCDDNNNSNIHGSCMKHSGCEEFFGLYTENKDIVSMAVIFKGDYITSRCILWTYEGITYYDRIYAINNNVNRHMQSCLEKLGYINISEKNIVTPNSSLNLVFQLKYGKDDLESFPYCDTMQFLKGRTISNRKFEGSVELTDTEGGYNYANPTCDCCRDESDDLEEIGRGIAEGYSYCSDCRAYSDVYNDYIAINESVESEEHGWILSAHSVDLYNGDCGFQERCVQLTNGEWATDNDPKICNSIEGDVFIDGDEDYTEIDGFYYRINSVQYDRKCKEMEPATEEDSF